MRSPEKHEVRMARNAANLTQTEAASLVGVALRTWQHWEFGDRLMPYAAWRLFVISVDAPAALQQGEGE